MEAIRTNISQTLPNLDSDTLEDVVTKLVDICGIQCLGDLEFIVESDLLGLLKPVQIRKLLRSWNAKGEHSSH